MKKGRLRRKLYSIVSWLFERKDDDLLNTFEFCSANVNEPQIHAVISHTHGYDGNFEIENEVNNAYSYIHSMNMFGEM